MVPPSSSTETKSAYIAGVACYGLWGFLPLYFHLLHQMGVGSWEMIAHRTMWSVLWAGGLVLLSRQGGQVAAVLRQPRTLLMLLLSTLAIFSNWTIYVFAVNASHVIEASLGYYINPLMNMAAGALLFRERMSLEGKVAIGLAVVGVAIQTVALGHLPLVSLGLAVSFCLCAILRKQVKADAQTGLFIECAYLALPGLAYVWFLQASGAGHFTSTAQVGLLLVLAGPATVAPLALFAWSAAACRSAPWASCSSSPRRSSSCWAWPWARPSPRCGPCRSCSSGWASRRSPTERGSAPGWSRRSDFG